jgi:hypothetical protein
MQKRHGMGDLLTDICAWSSLPQYPMDSVSLLYSRSGTAVSIKLMSVTQGAPRKLLTDPKTSSVRISITIFVLSSSNEYEFPLLMMGGIFFCRASHPRVLSSSASLPSHSNLLSRYWK